MHAIPFLYAGIDVQHPLKEGHDILFSRLYEEGKPIFANKKHKCLDVQLATRISRLIRVSLIPCPFFNHFPNVLLCGICVFFF